MSVFRFFIGVIGIVVIAGMLLYWFIAEPLKNQEFRPEDNYDTVFFEVGFELPEFLYFPQIIPFPELPEYLEIIDSAVQDGNTVYFIARDQADDRVSSGVYDLFRMDIDGGNFTELPNYIAGSLPPNAVDAFLYSTILRVDNESNLWVAEYGWNNYNIFSLIRKLDETGAEISSIDIRDFLDEGEWLNLSAFDFDDAGNLYISSDDKILVLDDQGHFLFSLEQSYFLSYLIRLSDGSIAIVTHEDSKTLVERIDVESMSLREIIGFPRPETNVGRILPGNAEYLFLYNEGMNLNGFIAETKESVKILSWSESALSPHFVSSVTFLPDGRISILRQSQSHAVMTESVWDVVLLTYTSYDNLPEREVLTFGMLYPDNAGISYNIEQFNNNSSTHRIHIIDYSMVEMLDMVGDDMVGTGIFSGGEFKLYYDIITGNGPDIFDLVGVEGVYQNTLSRGYLVDLYPLFEADTELTRGNLIEGVMTAPEIDGSLYWMITSFDIMTVVGDPSVLGSYPGWTLEEFIEMLESNPQADIQTIPHLSTGMGVLDFALRNTLDDYIDRASLTVDLPVDTVAELLELAATFPQEFEMSNTVPGQYIIIEKPQTMSITHFGNLDFYVYDLRNMFGGEIVFKGYPSINMDGNFINLITSLSISASCNDIDAAWEFVRMFLSDDYQRENIPFYHIPISKVIFEERLENAILENAERMRSDLASMESGNDGETYIQSYMESLSESMGRPLTEEEEANLRAAAGVTEPDDDIIIETVPPVLVIEPFSQDDADIIRNLVYNVTRIEASSYIFDMVVRPNAAKFFSEGVGTAQGIAQFLKYNIEQFVLIEERS